METVDINKARKVAHLAEAFNADDVSITTVTKAVEVINEEHKQVRFIATTETMDAQGEVVLRDGVYDKSYFFKNKAVFIDHNTTVPNMIGTLRRPFRRDDPYKMWMCDVVLNMDNPYAESIYRLAKEGLISSSIGFRRLKSRPPTGTELKLYGTELASPKVITPNWEWLELSVVAFPANCDAKAVPFDQWQNEQQKMLDELVVKKVCSREAARALGLIDTGFDIKVRKTKVFKLDI